MRPFSTPTGTASTSAYSIVIYRCKKVLRFHLLLHAPTGCHQSGATLPPHPTQMRATYSILKTDSLKNNLLRNIRGRKYMFLNRCGFNAIFTIVATTSSGGQSNPPRSSQLWRGTGGYTTTRQAAELAASFYSRCSLYEACDRHCSLRCA